MTRLILPLTFISVLDGLPAHYKTLSENVYRVLEDIGVSTEMRKLRMETAITREIYKKHAVSAANKT